MRWVKLAVSCAAPATLLVGSLSGCGGAATDREMKLLPLTGKITMDGAPLSGAAVVFIPTGPTKGIGAAGVTDEAGAYAVRQPDGKDGIEAGEYHVRVTKMVMPDGKPIPAGTMAADVQATESIPAPYSNQRPSGVPIAIPPASGSFDLDIKSKSKKK